MFLGFPARANQPDHFLQHGRLPSVRDMAREIKEIVNGCQQQRVYLPFPDRHTAAGRRLSKPPVSPVVEHPGLVRHTPFCHNTYAELDSARILQGLSCTSRAAIASASGT